MPSTATTIIAGVFAFGFFLFFAVGLFFSFRKFLRWIWKLAFYVNLKKNPESLELISAFIDKTPAEFKMEMFLLNEFSDKEVEGLVYAFKKIKRKMKGGFMSNGKSKS